MTVSALTVSPSLSLPIEYVTKTIAVLAQRRKGKTYTASVIAEELVTAGLPFVALDPTGAWWGLRASADGEGPGLPVTILGGEHGDVPLDRTDGKGVAELVVDEPGWYVIDFGLFESNAAEVQFAADFAQRLYRRKGQPNSDFPMHLFVDEADRFVPQKPRNERGQGSETTMLGAFEAIVRRGGLRGLGTTLISQRSAVVNKNVLEQADLLIVLRTVGPNDRKRIEEIVSAEGTAEQIAEIRSSMASLDLGEAWFWEPGEGLFQRVHIRPRRTFNSSATPKPGEKRVEPRRLATVDLEVIKTRWADTIERAKADDPKELHKTIRELQRQLNAQQPDEVEVEIRVPVVDLAVVEEIERHIVAAEDALTAANKTLAEYRQRPPSETQVRTPMRTGQAPKSVSPQVKPTPRADIERDSLSNQAAKMLAALASRHPLHMSEVAWASWSGYSKKSSQWAPNRRALEQQGLVAHDQAGWHATPAGLDAAGTDGTLPQTRDDVINMWRSRLPAQARAFFEVLVGANGHPVLKDDLAGIASYSRRSSQFEPTIRLLVSNGLALTSGDEVILNEEAL